MLHRYLNRLALICFIMLFLVYNYIWNTIIKYIRFSYTPHIKHLYYELSNLIPSTFVWTTSTFKWLKSKCRPIIGAEVWCYELNFEMFRIRLAKEVHFLLTDALIFRQEQLYIPRSFVNGICLQSWSLRVGRFWNHIDCDTGTWLQIHIPA